MKAHRNTILHHEQSFSIRLSDYYHAINEFHYHLEMEIIYIIEGKGTLLIGEQFEELNKGMLIAISPNIPHMLKFETHTYLNDLMKHGKIDIPLKLLTLHVDPEILGDKFLRLPENLLIKQLLTDACRGISFSGKEKGTIIALLYKIMHVTVYERMPVLMQLLNMIGAHRERKYITITPHQAAFNGNDENRLTKIYLYTLNNFSKNIILKDVSAIIYMVPNAFCRYFKQRTHKSYFTFLMEVRIRHACKLLKEQDYSIAVICYESGFSNLSNFNRHFKQLTGKTPLQYRQFFRAQTHHPV